MSARRRWTLVAALLAAGACRAGAPDPTPAPAPAPEPARPAPTTTGTPASATPAPAPAARPAPDASAAIRFMQRMIGHHAQALTMAALAQQRSERADVKLLAERITVSQRDETATMERWLRAHGAAVPAAGAAGAAEAGEHAAHHAAGAAPGTAGHDAMPGMATQAELEELATSSGRRFDRRFLDLMIRHHEGALAMVAELLATPGGTQDATVFAFATDVDADQRAEIARMRALRTRLAEP